MSKKDKEKNAVKYTGYVDIDAFLEDCLETMRVKGHDYREGNDADLIHNFRSVGQDLDMPPEKVWYIYASKHWKAIKTFIKEGGQSESEPIEGRIKDVLVYLLLLYRIVQEKKTLSDAKKLRSLVDEIAEGFASLKKSREMNLPLMAEPLKPAIDESKSEVAEKGSEQPSNFRTLQAIKDVIKSLEND